MRCEQCKCKLNIIETTFVCKCTKIFCMTHRLPEYHECTYDYKNDRVQLVKLDDNRIIRF